MKIQSHRRDLPRKSLKRSERRVINKVLFEKKINCHTTKITLTDKNTITFIISDRRTLILTAGQTRLVSSFPRTKTRENGT